VFNHIRKRDEEKEKYVLEGQNFCFRELWNKWN